MRQIRLILDTDNTSIGYLIDAEKQTYSCGGFDLGKLARVDESGEISDPTMLAKRLYLIINAALMEPTVAPLPVPESTSAVE